MKQMVVNSYTLKVKNINDYLAFVDVKVDKNQMI